MLDSSSKPIDLGFKRSRVRGTESAILRFWTVAEPTMNSLYRCQFSWHFVQRLAHSAMSSRATLNLESVWICRVHVLVCWTLKFRMQQLTANWKTLSVYVSASYVYMCAGRAKNPPPPQKKGMFLFFLTTDRHILYKILHTSNQFVVSIKLKVFLQNPHNWQNYAALNHGNLFLNKKKLSQLIALKTAQTP